MNIAEYREVCQLHRWLDIKRIKHTHIVNEQPSKQRAIAEKRMGKSKGFPDLLVFLNNGKNLAIEMKRSDKAAKATPEQLEWLKFLSTRGFECAVCHGFTEAVEFISEFLGVEKEVEF